MDETREQMMMSNEISEALTQPINYGNEIDEDELNAELEALELEAAEQKMAELDKARLGAGASAAAPSTLPVLPSAPTTAPVAKKDPKQKEIEDELAGLSAEFAQL